ncbi:MAG: exopolysaccharide biosynthesis polyprenyl glycosylphosphotransferase [Bacilli bacterium]|nr:exopolysaccharide biosynthesis polyprenyl glycosylphosphotransferase [Bacilli bacterium]
MDNYSIYKNTNKNHLKPTIEINKKLESKKNVIISITSLFLLFEIVCFSIIYFFLFQLRISHENQVPLNMWNWHSPNFSKYFVFFIVSTAVYLLFLYRYRIYRFQSDTGFADELYKVFKSYSFAILITIGVSFMLKYTDFSRLVVISYWLCAIISSGLVRYLRRLAFYRLAENGTVSKNVIIIGAGKVGKSLMDELNNSKWLGYKVVGFADDAESIDYKDNPYLGTTNELKNILHTEHIDELIITIPSERDLVNKMINDLRKLNVKITIIPDMFNLVMNTVEIGNINDLPAVTLVKTPMRGLALIVKRFFDMLASVTALIIISPVILITVVAIKLDSKGPVLYRQKRLGKNGKFFNMLKFRSMHINSDELLEELKKHNEMDGFAFKMKNDPRITKIGRLIRKYSIDELPQLLNVIKGDMSLVGPRPPLPTEVELYEDYEWRRLEVLPGLTGLWQVSGRSNLSFQQWMNLDIYYIENWSLALDFKIILKTVPVVLKGEGAY